MCAVLGLKGGDTSSEFLINCCSIFTKHEELFPNLFRCSENCYVSIPILRFACAFFSKQNSVTCWICGALKSVVALTLQEKVKLHVVF